MWFRRAALVAVVALGLAACGGGDDGDAAGARPVEVVAALYPLAEAARQVGGDAVDVRDLTPAGAEPHDLELTPGQVDDLEDADLVVAIGNDFQPAVEEVAGRRDEDTTFFVLDGLPLGDELDPHVWLDPTLMHDLVDRLAGALARLDPEHGAIYARNAQRFGAELDALDEQHERRLADCSRREIVTAHAAFGWLARRYGLEQHAIAGIAPDQEPSADRIARLADLVERAGITTIFTEPLVSPDIAETLAREAGGLDVATLDPLENLSDERAGREEGYLSVMRENLDALDAALDCG
jgi:zinc transport system substrate-binding protein